MGVLDTIATGFGNMGRVVSDVINQTQPAGGYQFEANREGGDQGFGGRNEAPQFKLSESGTEMELVEPARIESTQATQAEPVITAVVPAETTSYFNQASETGAVSESTFPKDTSAPLSQTFLDTYVPEARITTLAGYTTGNRGDTKTAVLEREYGYSPLQALAVQLESSKTEDKARGITGESKATRYYREELDRAKQDIRVGADVESYEKAKSGIAQEPNTQDYAADLATTSLWRSQGVVNVPGSIRDESGALKPEFKLFTGNALTDANFITKVMRTGEMGPYSGDIGKPFSSAYGTLDLATQQAISRQAAKTAGWNYEAADVASPVREKYENPLVLTGRGLNMFYKEATPTGIAPDLLSTEYNSAKTSERLAQLALTKPGTIEANLAAAAEVISPVVQGPNERLSNAQQSQRILEARGSDVIIPAGSVAIPSATGVVSAGSLANFAKVTEPEKFKGEPLSFVDSEARKTKVYVPGIFGIEGGQLGSGRTIEGKGVFDYITPVNTPGSILYNREHGIARRPRPSYPIIRRTFYVKPKHSKMIIKSQSTPKPDPKIFNLESINKNIIPKSLGADLFKFNLNPDKLVKSIGVRTRVQEAVKIKGDTVGLDQIKNIAGNVQVSDFGTRFTKGKGVSVVSGNINALVKNMLNPVKIRKIKMR